MHQRYLRCHPCHSTPRNNLFTAHPRCHSPPPALGGSPALAPGFRPMPTTCASPHSPPAALPGSPKHPYIIAASAILPYPVANSLCLPPVPLLTRRLLPCLRTWMHKHLLYRLSSHHLVTTAQPRHHSSPPALAGTPKRPHIIAASVVLHCPMANGLCLPPVPLLTCRPLPWLITWMH